MLAGMETKTDSSPAPAAPSKPATPAFKKGDAVLLCLVGQGPTSIRRPATVKEHEPVRDTYTVTDEGGQEWELLAALPKEAPNRAVGIRALRDDPKAAPGEKKTTRKKTTTRPRRMADPEE